MLVHKSLKSVWYNYSKTSKRFKAEGETERLTQNDLELLWYNLTGVKGEPLLPTRLPLFI